MQSTHNLRGESCMPKPNVIVAGVVGAVVVVGGIVGVVALTGKDKDNSSPNTTSQSAATGKLVDPDNTYKLFSDPSVTEHPDNDVRFGNGQTLTFVYDGSKTGNEESATLSYQLYYIQDDGKVQPMGGGNVEGKGSGTFTLSDSVFNSSAKDKKGFLELIGTYDTSFSETTGFTGKNVTLGMYSVDFDISE